MGALGKSWYYGVKIDIDYYMSPNIEKYHFRPPPSFVNAEIFSNPELFLKLEILNYLYFYQKKSFSSADIKKYLNNIIPQISKHKRILYKSLNLISFIKSFFQMLREHDFIEYFSQDGIIQRFSYKYKPNIFNKFIELDIFNYKKFIKLLEKNNFSFQTLFKANEILTYIDKNKLVTLDEILNYVKLGKKSFHMLLAGKIIIKKISGRQGVNRKTEYFINPKLLTF